MLPCVMACRCIRNLGHHCHRQNTSRDFVRIGIMGCTIMVHNTCEEKSKRDFDIKSLKDAHPTVAEFHYLGNCIQGKLVFCGFFFLFCFK